MQDDELRIEDLDDPHAVDWRSYALARRLWRARRSPHSGGGRQAPRRVVLAVLTTVLALTLVTLAGDNHSRFAVAVVLGAAPLAVTPGEAAPLETITGHAPTPVGASDWEQIALPDIPGMSVSSLVPSPTDPSTVYACMGSVGVSPPPSSPLTSIVVWRTHDAGAHWRSLPLPPVVTDWCYLQMAPDGSSRLTLNTISALGEQFYLSGDGGDSWMRVALPAAVRAPSEGVNLSHSVWASTHHLYCRCSYLASLSVTTTNYSDGSSVTTSTPHFGTALWRSDDDGRTWQHADNGLDIPQNDIGSVVQTRDENRLLTTVYRPFGSDDPPALAADLWETRDAGHSWRQLETTGECVAHLVVPADGNAAVGGGEPDFATVGDQVPSDVFDLRVIARKADGTWKALPPLPVPGASADHTGLLQVFEETDDGRLLAFGVDPHAGVPSDAAVYPQWAGTSSQWLWIWDPRVSRWLVWPRPLPLASRWDCAVCMEHAATWTTSGTKPGGTYLWLRSWSGVRDPGRIAYRVFVSNAPPGELTPQS